MSALQLGSAVDGYRGVEALKSGGTYSYSIQQDSQFEVGRGTYLGGAKRLTRGPISSSNGGTSIDLGPNTQVSIVALSDDISGLVQSTITPIVQAGIEVAGIFPDQATGLSATSSGSYFFTPSPLASEFLIMYLHTEEGAAEEISRSPSVFHISGNNAFSDRYELAPATAGQTEFELPFIATAVPVVLLNGTELPEGTITLTDRNTIIIDPVFEGAVLTISPVTSVVVPSVEIGNVNGLIAALAGKASVPIRASEVTVDPNANPTAGSLFAIIRGTITPDFYGAQASATPAGATNATSFVRQAISSGKHVELPGYYKLNDGVTGTTPGQVIAGFGRESSGFVMDGTFNLGAEAVFLASSGETGTELRDVGMEFYQPSVTDRANLIHYPPAFKVVGSPRARVIRCRISKAWQGINMAGNQGGATIQDVEMSAFDFGIWIDGALDAMRVDNFHYFPFDFVNDSSLVSVFRDGANFAMLVGRCDVLKLSGFMSICRGGAIHFYRGTFPGLEGFAQALITESDFDAYGGLLIDEGWVSASTCFFSLGSDASATASGDDVWIRLKSGSYTGNGNQYITGGPSVDRLIDISGDADVSRTFSDDTGKYISGDDIPLLETRHTAGSALVNISNASFGLPANVTLTQPKFKIGGNTRITFTNNSATDQGSGTSTLLQIDNDEAHIIANNRFTGRGVSLPPNYVQTSWRDNVGVAGNAGSGYRLSIADGTSVILPQGRGLMIVTDLAGGGESVAYLVGGTSAKLLDGDTPKWVSPTTTPASGKASIAYSGGDYRLFNNTGAGMTVGLDFTKVGAFSG
jgi:hypothetical protein